MSDQITVTFGGREVVLRKCGDHVWQTDNLRLIEYGDRDFRALHETLQVHGDDGDGDAPQAAFSALESKLRQLRSELDGVLGDKS